MSDKKTAKPDSTYKVGYGKPPLDKAIKKGEVRNPNGRPKGRRNLSTIIKDMLEHEFNWDLIDAEDVMRLKKKYKSSKVWEAIVATAAYRAMQGDTRAMTWLAKYAYGDKIDVTSNSETIGQGADQSVVDQLLEKLKEDTARAADKL